MRFPPVLPLSKLITAHRTTWPVSNNSSKFNVPFSPSSSSLYSSESDSELEPSLARAAFPDAFVKISETSERATVPRKPFGRLTTNPFGVISLTTPNIFAPFRRFLNLSVSTYLAPLLPLPEADFPARESDANRSSPSSFDFIERFLCRSREPPSLPCPSSSSPSSSSRSRRPPLGNAPSSPPPPRGNAPCSSSPSLSLARFASRSRARLAMIERVF
mmetsp:Transcript_7166/g.16050  ORF Transcript_7166/g.16050 Transcript_7166/m.16050 type:complete len:217 (-) Transcript_7166:52-702(-)